MADIKISALDPGSQAAGGDIEIVQGGASFKVTIATLAYQAANAVAITGGTITGLTNLTIANAGTLTPVSNDGAALGTTALSWADLFLASGGVINWDSGDVTITHSANTLAFAGAATAYTFNGGPVRPSADDGAALGVSGTAWSDLFLASGGVINWNAGDVTITHSANVLAFAGASTGYTFDALLSNTAGIKAFSGTAVPAGGTTGSGVTMSSTANLGIFFGSGGPTLVAAQGSLYLRTDGSGVANRLYVATNGSGGWTNVVTAI